MSSRGFGLVLLNVGLLEQNLPLQIAYIHRIGIHNAELSHACGGKVKQNRGAQASGTDHEDSRTLQALLTLDAEFRKNKVTNTS